MGNDFGACLLHVLSPPLFSWLVLFHTTTDHHQKEIDSLRGRRGWSHEATVNPIYFFQCGSILLQFFHDVVIRYGCCLAGTSSLWGCHGPSRRQRLGRQHRKGFLNANDKAKGREGDGRLSDDAKSVGSSRNKEETSKRATRCKMDTSTYILFIYMKIKSRVEIYNTRHVQTYRPSRARRIYYKLAQSDVAVQQTKTACMHMRCKHYTHN